VGEEAVPRREHHPLGKFGPSTDVLKINHKRRQLEGASAVARPAYLGLLNRLVELVVLDVDQEVKAARVIFELPLQCIR
jgi:hypothetical protein